MSSVETALKEHVIGTFRGRGVRVAVVDSGWDRRNRDVRVATGVSFVDPTNGFATYQSDDDHDRVGHGTACADLILRIAPECSIVPVRVFGEQLETSVSTVCAALEWTVERRFDVINMSLGTDRSEAILPLYRICVRAAQTGATIVAAGRNPTAISYPAVFDNVIGVGAGILGEWWNYRVDTASALEVEALGAHEGLLWLSGKRVSQAGPSYAAAVVSGILALLREQQSFANLEHVRRLLRAYSTVRRDVRLMLGGDHG